MLSETELATIVDLGNGLTAADVWKTLYESEVGRQEQESKIGRMKFDGMFDGTVRQCMALLRGFPKRRWHHVCSGVGWSPITVVALSWCKDITIEDVVSGWRLLPEEQRSPRENSSAEWIAGFVCPDILPDNKLSSLIDVGKDVCGVFLLIAARNEAPAVDIPEDDYTHLNTLVRGLIEARQPHDQMTLNDVSVSN